MTRLRTSIFLAGTLLLASASVLAASWQESLNAGAEAFRGGKYAEAERHYKTAIETAETDDIGGPQLLRSLNALAILYRVRGRYAEAEVQYKRLLSIQEAKLGPDHADVASTRANLRALHKLWKKVEAHKARVAPLEETHQGVRLLALAPRANAEFDITVLDQTEGLRRLRTALDTIAAQSSFSAEGLGTLKDSGDVVIVYDPNFPKWTRGAFKLAVFRPRFTVRGWGSVGSRTRRYLVVVGRYGIKYPTGELGGVIVHELIGHGLQHLRGKLRAMRMLDSECEAWLYELNAYQDFKLDKFTKEMVEFRQALEDRYCDDFKRYLRRHRPEAMALWEDLHIDVPRVLAHFDSYLAWRGNSGSSGASAARKHD